MAGASEPTRFSIVGGGWRAAAYLRIAEALPDRFAVTGVVVRDPSKGAAVERRFRVPTYRSTEAMLERGDQEFAVAAVRPGAMPSVLRDLADASVPALSETPPAWDLDELDGVCDLVARGARIQVAEQCRFRPMYAARLAIIETGRLGPVTQVQVSTAHGYHGISLMRTLLGVAPGKVMIEARSFTSPLLATPRFDGVPGEPTVESVIQSRQVLGLFWFPGQLGLYDFTVDQYYSGVRSSRVLVRGDRGEIHNDDVRWLDGPTTIHSRLERVDAGHSDDLKGFHLEGVLSGGAWVYRNPFAPARLSDDEIAVAACLDRMVEFVRTGTEFCSVYEAANDRYVDLMLEHAVATGEAVQVEPRYGRTA